MATTSTNKLLTIGDLADLTGVPAATLRSWESRYGCPLPTRLTGGHRRYLSTDVDAVLAVLRHREAGLDMQTAVGRAMSGPLRSHSVYAELRRTHPELTTQVLPKSTLRALSNAIEDECCARAEHPLLFGGFQRQTFLRASYARWAELARTAQAAVVFADLTDPLESRPGHPIEVALPEESPLNREWIVLCDAPDLPACLAAVERPGQERVPDARRLFDAVWTVDPRVVRHASRIAAALADEYRPGWRTVDLALLDEEPAPASADLRRAADLFSRMLGYLSGRR